MLEGQTSSKKYKNLITPELREREVCPDVMLFEIWLLLRLNYTLPQICSWSELLYNQEQEIYNIRDLNSFVQIYLDLSEEISFTTRSYNLSRCTGQQKLTRQDFKFGLYFSFRTSKIICTHIYPPYHNKGSLYIDHSAFAEEMKLLKRFSKGEKVLLGQLLLSPYEIIRQKTKEIEEKDNEAS